MDAREFLSRLTDDLSALLEAPEFERVYAGPWWETPIAESPPPAPPMLAWKCAVLRRRPEGGAEHWGHLFLVSGPDSARATVAVAHLPGVHRARFGDPVSFPTGSVGTPFTIIARPIAVGRETKIVDLARQLAARLGPKPPTPAP